MTEPVVGMVDTLETATGMRLRNGDRVLIVGDPVARNNGVWTWYDGPGPGEGLFGYPYLDERTRAERIAAEIELLHPELVFYQASGVWACQLCRNVAGRRYVLELLKVRCRE